MSVGPLEPANTAFDVAKEADLAAVTLIEICQTSNGDQLFLEFNEGLFGDLSARERCISSGLYQNIEDHDLTINIDELNFRENF